jgi:hypothetical protein
MSRYPQPKASDMFVDATSPLELAERHTAFTDSLAKALAIPTRGAGDPRATLAAGIDSQRDYLSKSLSPQTIDSVRNALNDIQLQKDWTTTSPLSSGLVQYDLEAPAKLLAPRPTPLRNRIPRVRGQGLNRQFKRILGFSGTGTGGAAGGPINPGINESTTNTFGPGNIAYSRGPKIAYAADDVITPYCQFGLSDEVSWAAQYAGQSFEDIRQLSTQALLYASMLSEERLLLGGRGTQSGYAGALPAPTNVTLTKRSAASNEVGASASITNLYVYVCSVSVWGISAPSSVATVASITSGQVVDVTLTDAPGALGYVAFVGTTTGVANCYAAAISNSSASINAAPLAAGSSVPGAPFTIGFTGGGTGGAPSTGATAPTGDSTAYTNNYDGILTYLTGADSGYVKRLNNTLSGADNGNVGNTFETAFSALYDAVKADPDEILAAGRDRKQLSDQLKDQSSSSYRITLDNATEVHNAKIGSLVTGIQNEVTGKMVDITVHPWLPAGNMPIISWTLPIPDSNVSETFSVVGPQDLQAIQWPVQEYFYSQSTWWFNTLCAYAPMWSGCIQGIFTA